MVSSGLLDMQRLATLEIDPLVDALNLLTKDYAAWIDEQRARIGRRDRLRHAVATSDGPMSGDPHASAAGYRHAEEQ
jgi:hypothetical protein